MAEVLGLNRVTYTNYERHKSEPGFETLKTMSKILDVSVDYLVVNDETIDFNKTFSDRLR